MSTRMRSEIVSRTAVTRPRHAAPVVFLDQSGKLGGAELFLADLAQACRRWSRVLLLEDGPFVELLRDRGVFVEAIALPDDAKQLSKSAGILDVLKTAPRLLAFYHEIRRRLDGADLKSHCNTPKANRPWRTGRLAIQAQPGRASARLAFG